MLSRCLTLFLIAFWLGSAAPADNTPEPLDPLPPSRLLSVLDLGRPGLEKVRKAAQHNDQAGALQELVHYYRNRQSVFFDSEIPTTIAPETIRRADDALKHIFYVGLGYEPQQYGPNIDWDSDPVKDIEWRANMQRFYWQESLIEAYVATKDEKYAKGWMDLTQDWIEKHPIRPKTFDWLDIQIGLRASNLCKAFEIMRRSPSMTPHFLAMFLASIYDHAQKSSLYPRQSPHNMVVLENSGLFGISVLFPEFQLSQHWLAKSVEVFSRTLAQQVNPEGVQKEWTSTYHALVASKMIRVLYLCNENHLTACSSLYGVTEKMFDYWVAMTAPDRTLPMFGDARRSPDDLPSFQMLKLAAKIFHRPIYDALADDRPQELSSIGSRYFPDAGMYFLRSGWDKDAIYMALHNSPPGLSVHDQPDNGTFELYAYGRWLMPDSGSFTYPNTPFAARRSWFRQTNVHQTLTLDGANSQNAPKFLLYQQTPNATVLAFENASYPRLIHRRTVFFIEKRYFVLIDEAIGDAPGKLDLHFQFAPGPFETDSPHAVHTAFKDGGNALVWEPAEAPVTVVPEEGQTSSVFYKAAPRPAIAFRSEKQAPAVYLTVVAPYLGQKPPKVNARFLGSFTPGQPKVKMELSAGNETWTIGRDLDAQQAWSQSKK